ncbi:hypothetical protein C8J31_101180 [Rhizobium sp. PP-CC-2G-626]|nr:hypothetical protein C8J31_101180 [Rhizobium sp. PP-CC-2G-626]
MATNITLADLTACDDGTVLVAKDAVDGSRRHISQVANGLRCGCVCYGCGRALVAKNGGDQYRHHFAHQPDEVTANCATAGETALHILGKELIAHHGRVTMPETWVTDLDGNRLVVTPRRSIDLTDIHLETAQGELVPDIIATTPEGRRLFIEIRNTHGCPPEKLEKLADMDVDVLEIDVSGYRAHSLDSLDEVVLDLAPREVIQSAALKARIAKFADEKKRRDEARIAEGRRKVAVYRDQDMGTSPRASDLADWMIEIGLSEYMDLDDDRPSAFLVPRRQWQAAILYRLMDTKFPEKVGAVPMLKSLRERNWPKPAINAMTSEDTAWIVANVDPDFKSAHEEVLAYLRRLRAAEVVHEDRGNRFYITQATLKRVAEALIHIERPEKRQAQAEAVLKAIRDLMDPEDEDWVEFDGWIKERASHYGTSVDTLLQDEDSEFDDLMDILATIRTAITRMQAFRQDEPPEDFAGLPLARLFLRLQVERGEAQDRAERERDERLKREAEARVAEITMAAGREFGNAASWLATPLPEHGGKTPSELASDGTEGLRTAQAVIARVREDREAEERAEQRRMANVRRLEDEAYRRILRQDIAKLWLNSSNRNLGGLKPIEACIDEKSLKRVLEMLTGFVDGEQKRRRR